MTTGIDPRLLGALGSASTTDIGLDSPETTIPEDLMEAVFNGPAYQWRGEVSLNPEMIIAMVRHRLRNLDEQIIGATNEIDGNASRAELLTRQQEVLTAIRGAAQKEGAVDDGDDWQLEGMTIEIDGEVKGAATWLELVGLNPGDFIGMNIGSLNSELQKLKSQAGRANSSNEMLMLQIQTLTQQRSQTIQIGTSLIKKMDEGSMSIARNI